MINGSILEILACPDCGNDLISLKDLELKCIGCGRLFEITKDRILRLVSNWTKPLPQEYNDPDYLKMSELFDESSSYFTDSNKVFGAIHDSSHKIISSWSDTNTSTGWTCDLGCGRGFHRKFYEGNPSHLIGVDFRLESLRAYRRKELEPVLIQADLTRLPFKDATISSIISVYSLEHVYHLSDAVSEMARVAQSRNRHYIGLPCEGGMAWSLGRKVTSERTMSKRYDLDYSKYIRLEHCNDAIRVLQVLATKFNIDQRHLFPLFFLPFISINLTLTVSLKKIIANQKND